MTASRDEAGAEKYGARVYYYADGVIQVMQTVKKGGRYVVAIDPARRPKSRFVNPGDDALLASVVRSAGLGEL